MARLALRPIPLIIATILFFLLSLSLLHPSSPYSALLPLLSASTSGALPITYIPFTFSLPMLLQTLHSYNLNYWSNIIIIDNSWSHTAYHQLSHLQAEYNILDVIPTPVHLRFSQLQSYIDTIHHQSTANAGYYFWSHTDLLLVPHHGDSRSNNTFTRARSCIEAGLRNTTMEELGVMFFHYDILSGVTSNARRVAPWDPNMPQYGSDCDRYHRLRLGGMQVRDCYHDIGEILHLHSLLSEEDFQGLYDESSGLNRTERIDRVMKIDEAREQYSWRKGGMGGGEVDLAEMGKVDEYAKDAEGAGGERYFDEKWGEGHTCELEGRTPIFDLVETED